MVNSSAFRKIAIVIIVIIVLLAILLLIHYTSEENNLKHIRGQVEVNKGKINVLLEDNGDIFKYLEQEVYPVENEVTIAYIDGKLMFSDFKDEFKQNNMKEVFECLNCESVEVKRKDNQKELRISFGNVIIDPNNVFRQTLVYCEDYSDTVSDNWTVIAPNWYYEVWFYPW
jgi:hypothetical protein